MITMASQAAGGWRIGRRAVLALLVSLVAPGAVLRSARAGPRPPFFADGTDFRES
jgi:hypothetical protein